MRHPTAVLGSNPNYSPDPPRPFIVEILMTIVYMIIMMVIFGSLASMQQLQMESPVDRSRAAIKQQHDPSVRLTIST
jgi:hypothetical protein